MKQKKKYFKSLYVKGNEEYLHNEFSEKLPLDGLFEGEKIIFRLWDSARTIEQVLDVNWEEGSGAYTTDGISIAGQIILGNDISSEKKLIKITDALGREINGDEKDVMLLYIYDDGSIERLFFND